MESNLWDRFRELSKENDIESLKNLREELALQYVQDCYNAELRRMVCLIDHKLGVMRNEP